MSEGEGESQCEVKYLQIPVNILFSTLYLPCPQAPVWRGQTGSAGRRGKDAKRATSFPRRPAPLPALVHLSHNATRTIIL